LNRRCPSHAPAYGEALKILLVEDNPGDARLFREALSEVSGLTRDLTVAASLGEALEHLRHTKPDVGVIDLGLPDASGLEAVTAVAGLWPDLPLVVLTGFDDDRMVVDALRIGAQDYLGKNHLEGQLLARTLRSAIERHRISQLARDAIEARDRILGVVAHDLRSPLSTISMSAEVIASDFADDEQKVKQIRIIRRSSARMKRLIDDLLDIARIEDSLPLELGVVDPKSLVREAGELHGALANFHALRLEVQVPKRVSPVRADKDRVMQILSNLIGNAIKFTPAGGRIRIRAEPSGEHVSFSVEDDGPGIPADDLPRLFQPFWQQHRTDNSGAGLGLTIALGVIEAHGGKIWPESELGRGTTVYFTLPVAY
jgi:signal transduction histidine kinase